MPRRRHLHRDARARRRNHGRRDFDAGSSDAGPGDAGDAGRSDAASPDAAAPDVAAPDERNGRRREPRRGAHSRRHGSVVPRPELDGDHHRDERNPRVAISPTGMNVLVSAPAGLLAYPIAGGAAATINPGWRLRYVHERRPSVLYTTPANALKRSTVASPSPTTLAPSGFRVSLEVTGQEMGSRIFDGGLFRLRGRPLPRIDDDPGNPCDVVG